MKRMMIVGIALSALVASRANAETQRFSRSEGDEPLVTDNVTGLVWQGCVVGKKGTECSVSIAADVCTGGMPDAKQCTWKQALAYCENLVWAGYSDWRLPNRSELSSIVDDRKDISVAGTPAIDTSMFPGTPASYFWSSPSYAGNPYYAWRVDFGFGFVSYGDKSNAPYDVRCVRSGPWLAP